MGLAHASVAPYGVFHTSDGVPILISIQNDREWIVMCREVLGDPALGEHPRFATNVARVRHREETDALVARWFKTQDSESAVAKLMAADVAFGRVNDIGGLVSHPHFARNGAETQGGLVKLPVPGAQIFGDAPAFGPVPALGAHTAEVRREFAPI
jgi:formyl-CoA transferase